ncbi:MULTISPECIES: type II secretion system F family protein [unclassified Mesorhizobium]|uniref:type II secretion system F family protein n=1 Tax=unclassified Mesorhizobium TaxID=325217 RepID=UPI000FD89A4C|nr:MULTISPECIES: type II secretion system F family protein [unclassified Mesorhizobium]RWL45351.1 MAG: type II secretion system F family protein [Mesorhizobium sp.]TGQ17443.1 type II secretion system F family protein [Mesorhizobium sp. M2E.F.Ca.ET.219.01.1.1]TGS17194.1 type II secretion system F family protein [Mesorhizobium sp. M2E.F.Ca.ET.209.01.1.1]TGT76400.1 type II secretion system F family protein [Mesorhizobium sp. M2E.F.Ca.ET.166.01.1.1]TGW02515.1 type II secretion system F family prot
MFEGFSPIYVVYAAAALTGIMIAEGLYLLYAGRSDKRMAINRRMKLAENKISQEQVLIQLRKERGIDGHSSVFSLDRFRALRTQSGMTTPLPKFLMITSGVAFALALLTIWKGLPLLFGLILFLILLPVLPVMAMRFMRKRRHKRFGIQLPEALELITRGLKAGHPVPVAIAMVAREMADPIGTEFGVVADEVTYGSDLVSALNNLFDRVGHEDLPLFVTAVSIQSSSGGNLREILDGLSATIRERGKLRRKVRAISTEGRMSAYILTAVPVLLFTAIMVLMPQFYQDVWDEPKTWYMLSGTILWLLLGNAIMFKMSNFRF